MSLFQRRIAARIFEDRCAGRDWYRTADAWRQPGSAPSIATRWFSRLQADQQTIAELSADHRRPLDLTDIVRLVNQPPRQQPAPSRLRIAPAPPLAGLRAGRRQPMRPSGSHPAAALSTPGGLVEQPAPIADMGPEPGV